jgi:hypothetical protein
MARLEEKQWQDSQKQLCRYLEGRSEEDVEFFCVHGYLPEMPIPGRPVDTSAWQESSVEDHKRAIADRNEAELEFFCVHGFWPERRKGGSHGNP